MTEKPAGRTSEDITHEEVRSRTYKAVGSMFGRQLVMRVLSFAGVLVLARLLAPQDFGVFAIANFVLMASNAFISSGGGGAALIRQKEPPSEGEYGAGLLIQVSLAIGIALLVAALAPLIVDFYELSARHTALFQITAVTLVVSSLKILPTVRLQRAIRHDLIALADIAEYVVFLAVALALALSGAGVWALIAGMAVRAPVGVLTLWLLSRKAMASSIDWSALRGIANFGLILGLTNLAHLGDRAIIPLMMGATLGISAAGVASLARTVLEAVSIQPLALLATVQFRLYARVQEDADAIARVLRHFLFVSGACFLPVLAALSILAPHWVPLLFNEDWQGLQALVPVLAIAFSVRLVVMPLQQVLKAIGKVKIQLYGAIAYILVLAGMTAGLSGSLGLAAYALGVFCADGLLLGIFIYTLRRDVSWRVFDALLIPVLACAAAVLAVAALAQRLPEGVLALALLGAVFGVVYLGLLLCLAGSRIALYIEGATEFLGARSLALQRLAHGLAVCARRCDLRR
ncbi:oligosaccharide flippase family protein [Oceanicaulis alexandrii]|uniref:oligosaccharide flippase family protein n=1 Tax=Oceanicaulis alexandrii TaxID=153233 RepID=UPI002357CB96|nr:oligosaccharide flippase family protein [Oceanicaulis alexandrii]